MELQEFIATSLTQIVNGVLEAQRAVRDSGALVSPQMRATHSTESIGPAEGHGGQPVFRVEFDVAVTAMSGQGSKAGIGVMVGSLGLGAKGHSESTSNRDSRLRFSIPLLLPLQQSEKPK